MRLTPAQQRLLAEIRSQGGDNDGAEYWPVMNAWVRDKGPAAAFALRNINRTVEALIRSGHIIIDDGGLFHITKDWK